MKFTIPILIGLLLFNAPLWAGIPEESVWSSFLCAGTFFAAIGALILARREHNNRISEPHPHRLAFLGVNILLGISFLTVTARIIRQHGAPAFIGPMVQACIVLTVYTIIFRLSAWFGQRSRLALYGLTLAIVAGATMAANYGVREFILHWQAGERSWRVFGTSTPDFFAGYLVMTAPLTLALFLGAKKNGISLLYGLATLLQLIAIVTTLSRFALVSLSAACLVMVIALVVACRNGLAFPVATRIRCIAILAAVLIGAVALGGPVLHRLQNPEKNSTDFRIWTWKGTVAMVRDHVTIGTGFGTYLYDYPKYALTGFTRLAHNSYLQFFAECGFLGGVALLVCLMVLLIVAWSGLRVANAAVDTPSSRLTAIDTDHGEAQASDETEAKPSVSRQLLRDLVNAVSMADDRFLLAGLLSGLGAGLIQNLIDSDWYIFAIGFTFSALAGLALALSPHDPAPVTGARASHSPAITRTAIAGMGILLVVCVVNGLAAALASGARVGLASPSPRAVESAKLALRTAHRLAPWNGGYVSDLGYIVYFLRKSDPSTAAVYLRRAIKLQPDASTYKRLGAVLTQSGDTRDAIIAYKNGLRSDPNSLVLLLAASSICPPSEAMGYYVRMAAVEDSPVGQVRALGEIVEEKFAKADAAVADLALNQADPQKAVEYFFRAEFVLEKYVDEGGSSNPMRMGISGGRANPAEDRAMSALYDHAMSELVLLHPGEDQSTLLTRHREYAAKFKGLIEQAGH